MFPKKFTKGNMPIWKAGLFTLCFVATFKGITAEMRYPDGDRNVIPLIQNKFQRAQQYNDGTVMAHVIGSAGMNFLYYFYILGVACENTDPDYYRLAQKDFEFCQNKTGRLPPQIRNQPLGSIPKPCEDWRLHGPCYKNLAEDYDICLMNKPGLLRKGSDALRFTHAYAKFICGNTLDTEAHLMERYTKHDLVVDGVFQCFPHLQDRIVNCIKRDKVSKTLCNKFFIVHACFGKYYNDDNCQDVQPIYYMDDLFRNMSTTLNCPPRNDIYYPPSFPPTNSPTPPQNGWTAAPPTHGWTHQPPKTTPGWTSREEYSLKENPWPGERGRPWSLERDREPYIKENQRYPQREYDDNFPRRDKFPPNHSNLPIRDNFPSEDNYSGRGNGGAGNGRGRVLGDTGSGRKIVVIDTHSDRPYPDAQWSSNSKTPWVNVMDRGSTGLEKPSSFSQRRNEIDASEPTGDRRAGISSSTRGPNFPSQYVAVSGSSERNRGDGLSSRGRFNDNQQFYYSSSSTPRGPENAVVALPPSGFAVTRTPQEPVESGDNRAYFNAPQGSLAPTTSNKGYNFYSFK